MPIPNACQPIQNEIDALTQERQEAWADVQQALDDGDPRAKWAAAARAAALTRQLQARADALEACVVDNGGPGATRSDLRRRLHLHRFPSRPPRSWSN
jgi:hypothetical protein